MDTAYLSGCLDRAVDRFRGSRSRRFFRSPFKLFFSKVLEIFARRLGTSLRLKARTFWGQDMTVVVPETVSLKILRYGFFEEGLTRMVLEHVKPGMTFVDIGAHFGYFTLLSSMLVGPEGRVHSFEPTPSTFAVLQANAAGRGNIVLNPCAVDASRRQIVMTDYGIAHSAYNSVHQPRLRQSVASRLRPSKISVEAVPMDFYLADKGVRPDFIKIDAEGSEHQVILGLEKTIERFHPILSVEVGEVEEGRLTSQELIRFIAAKGYQPYEFRNGKILPHAVCDAGYVYDNILFLRRP